MDEILIIMDLSETTNKLIKIGLILGENLKSSINIIVAEKEKNSSEPDEIKYLEDKQKLNGVKDIIQQVSKSLNLNGTRDNINYFRLPNCEPSKKAELVTEFIGDHKIAFNITSIQDENLLPFQQQDATHKIPLKILLDDISCPSIFVSNEINLLNIKDIGIFFSDIEDASDNNYDKLKILADIFGAKIHLMAVVKPNSVENAKIISLLKGIADKHEFKSYSINTVINNSIVEGVNFFSQKRILDMIVIAKPNETGLFETEILHELLYTNNSPIFCYMP